MSHPPYTLTGPIGTAATLGLIVLQTDETIEQDFRRLFRDEALALYATRIPMAADLTPDTIAQMALDLPASAGLLPRAARFDAVGYACTSGTTLIGADRVRDLVRSTCDTRAVCNPLDAARAACRHLGITGLGIVSPYSDGIAQSLAAAFAEAGIPVAHTVNFGEEVEANVARIDPASIAEAARGIAAEPGVDGIFLSCTNLRTLDVIPMLEAELGLPVFGSNLALAWHMAQSAGAAQRITGPYRLLSA